LIEISNSSSDQANSAEKGETTRNCSPKCEIETIVIEDSQEDPILEQSSSDQNSDFKRKAETTSILGKRPRVSADTSSVDEQWIDLLGDNCDADPSILSPASSSEFSSSNSHESPIAVKDSLLGRFMKRQRVNSAATRHEFSFMPTVKPSNLHDNINIKTDPIQACKAPLSSKPSMPSQKTDRARDLKASFKINSK